MVCNNAGVNAPLTPAWEYDPLDWQWLIGVNLFGVIHGVRSFVPHLIAQGTGHVVNTASMVGLTTVPFIAPYTASKWAVVGITESLQAELHASGSDVGVSLLCPGLVPTRLGESARNRPDRLIAASRDRGPARQFDNSNHEPVMPAEIAKITAAAIEANRFYVTTHRSARQRIREHVDALLQGTDS